MHTQSQVLGHSHELQGARATGTERQHRMGSSCSVAGLGNQRDFRWHVECLTDIVAAYTVRAIRTLHSRNPDTSPRQTRPIVCSPNESLIRRRWASCWMGLARGQLHETLLRAQEHHEEGLAMQACTLRRHRQAAFSPLTTIDLSGLPLCTARSTMKRHAARKSDYIALLERLAASQVSPDQCADCLTLLPGQRPRSPATWPRRDFVWRFDEVQSVDQGRVVRCSGLAQSVGEQSCSSHFHEDQTFRARVRTGAKPQQRRALARCQTSWCVESSDR